MTNSKILVRALSITSVVIGVVNLALYFYNLIPGQVPTSAPFYLRMGIIFIVGIPILIQVIPRRVTPSPRVASYLALVGVLAVALVVMMLLLPSTLVGSSWGN